MIATQTVSRENTNASGATSIIYVPLERILDNPYQPRLDYEPEGIEDLAAGIFALKESLSDTLGLQQIPVARFVQQRGGEPVSPIHYHKLLGGQDIVRVLDRDLVTVQLHFGHRRLRAFRLPPYHFAFDSEVYRPMHIKPEAIAPGLARSRPSTPPPLIPAELRAGRPIIAPADTANFGDAFEDDPMTDKQAAAYTWMDRNRPNGGTQADMRKALNLSKGYASQLWHAWQSPTPPINGAPASPSEPASTAATDAYGRPLHTIHADDPASAEALAAIRAAIESGAATINRRK